MRYVFQILLLSVALSVTAARASRDVKVILVGHGDDVRSVLFSPDGKTVASGSADQTVKLWNPKTGDLLRTFIGHCGEKNSIAFSHDGRTLAISMSDQSIGLYDPSTGKLIRSFAGSQIGGPLAFSPDDRLLITKSMTEKGNLNLWETETGKVSQVLAGHTGPVVGIAYSPDGKLIASVADKSLRLWDAQAGKFLMNLAGFKYSLNDVTFSPDSTTVVAADDITILFWDARTGKLQRQIQSDVPVPNFQPPVRSIIFSPNGQLLAISSYDHKFTIIETATGNPKFNFTQDSLSYAAAFSPGGNTIVTACEPKALYFWDLETAELRMKIGSESESSAVAYSPDGNTAVSDGGIFDDTLYFWDLRTGNQTMHPRNISSSDLAILIFSPDGKLLCGAGDDNRVYVWDLDLDDPIQTIKIAEYSTVASIAFSPNGKLLLVSGGHYDGTIRLISTETWKIQRTLMASGTAREEDPISGQMRATRLGVIDAEFSPDGRTIAAIVDDGKALKAWNTQTGALVRTQPMKQDMSSCFFSLDLKLLACGTQLRDAANGALLHAMPGASSAAFAFSEDGRLTLTAGVPSKNTWHPESTAKVWEVQTGKLLSTLTGHTNKISSARFSPDGRTVLTGSDDGTVRLWDPRTGKLKAVFAMGNEIGRE